MTTPSQVITAIMARVVVEIPTATSSVTAADVAKHTSPPHIRWVPDADVYAGAPKRIGADGARSVLGVNTTWEVTCWGADLDGAFALRDALIRATALEAHGMVAYGPGTWNRGGAVTHGEAVTLRITLQGYVPETAPALETITTVHVNDTTGASATDGVLQVGESGTP